MSGNIIQFSEEQNVVEIRYEGVNAAILAQHEVRITDLENQFIDNNDNIIGRLDQLDADVAEQSNINTAQSAAITAETSAREIADSNITTLTAENINALALSTADAIELEAETRAQAILDEATARGAAIASSEAVIYGDMAILATSVEGMATQLGAAQASIIEVQDALVTETAARTAQYTALQADFGDTNAAILSESVARADADSALATSITVVEAVAASKNKTFRQTSAPTAEGVGDLWYDTDDGNKIYRWDGSSWVNIQDGQIPINAAAILAEQTARADADTALASSITSVSAVANAKNTTFRQASAPTALATGDLWYDSDDNNKLYRWSGSAWVATDDSRIAVNAAAIVSEASARASADSALASDITTVTATANARNTVFRQASAPTANATGDLWYDSDDGNKVYRWSGSSWVATDDTRIAANTAAITTEATARADADGDIYAKYAVKVDVNGHVSGFGLISEDNDGTVVSEFVFTADSFKIYDGSGPLAPFSVSGGVVTMTNVDIVGSLTLTNAVQSFTPTWTGYSSGPTQDMKYLDLGAVVLIWCDATIFGTSNSAVAYFNNLPSAIRPGTGTRKCSCTILDNGSSYQGHLLISSTGTCTLYRHQISGTNILEFDNTFTTSGNKGIVQGFTGTYAK